MSTTLVAPLSGWCAALDESPDPVFRQRILGDGVSIDPTSGEVFSPCDARVHSVTASAHALTLSTEDGAEVLIHIGIDTVQLNGDGFEARVKAGDVVKTGDLLLRFDLERLARAAPSLRSPVLLLKRPGLRCRRLAPEGPITAGDALLRIEHDPQAPASEHKTPAGQHRAQADAHPAPAREHTPPGDDSAPPENAPAGAVLERRLVLGLAHGIHARPAALLAAAVEALDVDLEFVAGHGRSANARSPLALMALGASHRDTLTLRASGADAEAALSAVVPLLEPLAAASDSAVADSSQAPSCTANAPGSATTAKPAPGAAIPGQIAVGGLAMGVAWQLQASPLQAALAEEAQVLPKAEEQRRFETALDAVAAYLDTLAQGSAGLGAEIARAHLAILNDVELAAATRRSIDTGLSAAAAWTAAVAEMSAALQALVDKRLAERVDDLRDVSARMLSALCGQAPTTAAELPDHTILLADNLLPSQLLELNGAGPAGICLAGGGSTSHVAILAASRGIPMLVAAGPEVLGIDDGAELLLDAQFGALHLRPAPPAAADFSRRVAALAGRDRAARAHAREPCVTTDGARLHIYANLGSREEAPGALDAGAEGCGLLRTEFLFMHGRAAPDVAAQRSAYQAIADALESRPLTIRTLDAGSDKPLAYVDHPPEENPALGLRGIRLSMAQPALFERQLLALLQVRSAAPLKIMLPMVSSLEELEGVRSMLDELAQAHALPTNIELGVMLETPAAALTVDVLAEQAAFFSIGTNDLTQYTLAADRTEPRLAASLDALHPAVLRLIQTASRAASARGRPLSVCGHAAGDPLAAPILLGLGLRELSMAPAAIAGQKALLRQVSIEACERLAAAALASPSADRVRELAREFLTRLPREQDRREDRA